MKPSDYIKIDPLSLTGSVFLAKLKEDNPQIDASEVAFFRVHRAYYEAVLSTSKPLPQRILSCPELSAIPLSHSEEIIAYFKGKRKNVPPKTT